MNSTLSGVYCPIVVMIQGHVKGNNEQDAGLGSGRRKSR